MSLLKPQYWLLIAVLLLFLPAESALANIWFCDGNGDGTKECLCIAWQVPGGEKLEMRCNGGGGSAPPGYSNPIPPTWGGSGSQPPSEPAPGMPLPMSPVNLAGMVANANQTAYVRAKGDKDPYSTFWIPDECTALFNNNPFGLSGYSLLNGYIVYRHGEGVQAPDGTTPCSAGAAAWTTCCEHKKYVFICNRSSTPLRQPSTAWTTCCR